MHMLAIYRQAYLDDAAVDAVVRVPEPPVISPLPDGPFGGLSTALLQHDVHSKDALSWQAGHQLTLETTGVGEEDAICHHVF